MPELKLNHISLKEVGLYVKRRISPWRAVRNQCFRCACPMSEGLQHSEPKSRGFETSEILKVIKNLISEWLKALHLYLPSRVGCVGWWQIDPFFCIISRHMVSERRRYICNVLPSWLSSCPVDLRYIYQATLDISRSPIDFQWGYRK